ncbi:MAG: four helix bundle protein [Bacteroidetes bacterium]|nr:four helix bundle protein [Bacteroidota bacterium]|tara:strand:+ start:182 stop:541 length:360 start_codon:yes stop_codon:yes gene_type:complete
MSSVFELEIYKRAFKLAVDCRAISLRLSQPDKYEVGSQLRRSSQSVKDNIVEGYGRRRYNKELLKFLTYSYSSLLEARSQIQFIQAISPNLNIPKSLNDQMEILSVMIHNFIRSVEQRK